METGVLSQDAKKLIEKNRRELSSIEANILSEAKGKEIKTIMVTSCSRAEGKTSSSISMAYGLASSNLKVLLIDGNLYSPKIHELFGFDGTPGFSDFIVDGLKDVIRGTELEYLKVMTHGTKIKNTLDVFRSKNLKTSLNELKNDYDYVILDGDSALSSSDMSVAAKNFDGIIFVVECEKTKWEIVQMTGDKMKKLGGNIIGAVMNKRQYYIPRFLYGKV